MSASPAPSRCTKCSLPLPLDIPPRTARVDELLRKNLPPRDSELLEFRHIVESGPETLSELDQQIAQVRELLDKLLLARGQAESHLNDGKALVHPIRSIPSEILLHIFACCVPSWFGGLAVEKTDSLDPRQAPWTLTRVCRRWRQLAIDCPMLWTYLELNVDRHDTHITPRQCVFKTGLYLGRSGSRSLSVILYGDMTDHAVIPVLEFSTPRWQRLATRIPMHALQSFSGNVFPRLSILEVSYPPDQDLPTTKVDTFTSISAPILQTVYTRSPSWSIFDDVQIPWPQIIEVAELPAFDVRGAHWLRQCTKLEEIEINVTSRYYTVINCSISLPKLKGLTMAESATVEPGRSKEFLDHLNAHNLSSLALSYPVDIDQRRIQFPENLRLVETAEKLTTLEVRCAMNAHADNTQSRLAFLSLLPNTDHFQLHDPDVTMEFFSGLKRSSSSSRLPRMRILDIGDCRYDAQCIDLIFDMLESRCDLAAPAESDNDDTVHDATDERLVACLETAIVPRSLYSQTGDRWEVILRTLNVQCGVA